MKKLSKIFLMFSALIAINACATKTQLIDMDNDSSERATGLESRDFEKAASTMIADILESGELNKPGGGRYVLIVSRIENDTMQRIDVEKISKKIRMELKRSGKVAVTNIEGDARVAQIRSLQKSKLINQATTMGNGQVIAPDISLSGKINQSEFALSNAKRIEYTFSLDITDLKTGLTLWEGEEIIAKLADEDAVSW